MRPIDRVVIVINAELPLARPEFLAAVAGQTARVCELTSARAAHQLLPRNRDLYVLG